MKDIFKQRVKSLIVGVAVAFACGGVIISAQTESFSALVSRLLPEFRKSKRLYSKADSIIGKYLID